LSYSHTTRAALRTQLATRLSDSDNVHWTATELNRILNESLRVFNAMAQLYRARGSFSTTPGAAFYDLATTVEDVDGNLLLARSVTDRDLADEIADALIESFDGSYVYSGSEQFTGDEILKAINRRRDRFLLETGMVLTASTTTFIPDNTARYALSDSVMDVRRAAWKTQDGSYSNLWRQDERQLEAYLSNWYGAGARPQVYSTVLQPSVGLLLAPLPQDGGYLHLVTTQTGATLNFSGIALGVPDDYAWVVKYGALADLCADGGDSRRAEYCEQRWAEGLSLARISSSLLDAKVNGVPVPLMSLQQLDSGDPTWQDLSGKPLYVAVAGHNLVALSPVPGVTAEVTDGAHSVLCDVVRNAPLPASDSEYVEVGREHLSDLLAYMVHVAMFKEGAAELSETVGGYEGLLKLGALHNERLRAASQDFEALHKKATDEEGERPRRKAAA
jgi:hypothetical protein